MFRHKETLQAAREPELFGRQFLKCLAVLFLGDFLQRVAEILAALGGFDDARGRSEDPIREAPSSSQVNSADRE